MTLHDDFGIKLRYHALRDFVPERPLGGVRDGQDDATNELKCIENYPNPPKIHDDPFENKNSIHVSKTTQYFPPITPAGVVWAAAVRGSGEFHRTAGNTRNRPGFARSLGCVTSEIE